MRTIVIGDIHGCVEEFKELVDKVQYERGKDRLLLLGDLIDRGPDSPGVVKLAIELGADSVMANHEEKALRWRKHEKRRKLDDKYKNPMTSVAEKRLDEWRAIPDEHWDWIASWPNFVHVNDKWTAVHAGCMPDFEVEKQLPNELIRLRYVKTIPQPSGYNKYKMVSLSEAGDLQIDDPTRAVHWTTLWNGPRHIVYGHYSRDIIYATEFTLGLDTSCVHGGKLSAAIFSGNELDKIVQVQAHKVYNERLSSWKDD